jgi:DNA-binding protein H-NS
MTDTTAVTSTPSNDAGDPKTDSTTAPDSTTASTPPAAAADPKTDATKAPEPQVPESYELQMPEGIELDKASADEFTTIAKELKLDQAAAQKLADIAAKQAQRQVEAHTRLVESWVESVKADKDIGGDKLEENLGIARKALDAFGTPELRDVLNASGLGNHPEVIKAFVKAGKAISEDRFVAGSAKGADTDPAKKMFPNLN